MHLQSVASYYQVLAFPELILAYRAIISLFKSINFVNPNII